MQKAELEQPDLILMEGTLPNMEACRQMRKIENLQRVPILMVTNVGGCLRILNMALTTKAMTSQPHLSNGATSLRW